MPLPLANIDKTMLGTGTAQRRRVLEACEVLLRYARRHQDWAAAACGPASIITNRVCGAISSAASSLVEAASSDAMPSIGRATAIEREAGRRTMTTSVAQPSTKQQLAPISVGHFIPTAPAQPQAREDGRTTATAAMQDGRLPRGDVQQGGLVSAMVWAELRPDVEPSANPPSVSAWRPSSRSDSLPETAAGQTEGDDASAEELSTAVSGGLDTGLSLSLSLREGYDLYLAELQRSAMSRGMRLPAVPPTFDDYAREVMQELRAIDTAKKMEELRVREAMQRGAIREVPQGVELIERWTVDLATELKKDQARLAEILTSATPPPSAAGSQGSSIPTHTMPYHAMLYALPPEELAKTTASAAAVMLLSAQERVSFVTAAIRVGEAVMDRLRHMQLCKQMEEIRKEKLQRVKDVAKQRFRQHRSSLKAGGDGQGSSGSTSLSPESQAMEEEYQRMLQRSAQIGRASDASLRRLRLLTASLDAVGWGRERKSLVGAVDRLLDVKGWCREDSFKVGAELLASLISSAKVPAVESVASPVLVGGLFRPSAGKSSSQRYTSGALLPAFEHEVVSSRERGSTSQALTPHSRRMVGTIRLGEDARKGLLEGDLVRGGQGMEV